MAQIVCRQSSIDFLHKIDNAEYLMRRVAAVAVGLCLETPLQELDSIKEFSAEELAEAWPRLRYGIYI